MRNAGETDSATELAASAAQWFSRSGGGDGARLADYLLAALHADAGAPSARAELAGVLDHARHGADRDVEVLALDSRAALHVRAFRMDDALCALDAADTIAAAAPYLWPGDRVEGERVRSALTPPARG